MHIVVERSLRDCWLDTATEARGGDDGSLRKGECVYDDFSFLALGESAPWEFTPFTPLALSFFDLLLAGTCFFFKVCAWACSLHRRSWKLINFHIMKA